MSRKKYKSAIVELGMLLLGCIVLGWIPTVQSEICTLGEKTPTPNYTAALDASYTFIIEMTDLIAKKTYYVHETRQKHDDADWAVNVAAVHVRSDTTSETFYYYDAQRRFVHYKDGGCSVDALPFDPWGWWDEDPQHGSTHYGPSSILRLAGYLDTEKFTTAAEFRNDVMCEGWKACASAGDRELHYFYSAPNVSMPDAPYFGSGNSAFPVHYSVRKMDETSHIEYNILMFVPFVVDHSFLETPRGSDCENVTSLLEGFNLPTMPEHYSFHQEVVYNPSIEGVQNGTQKIDYSKAYYSADMSLIRMDFIPSYADETVFGNQDPVKIILDYNTGVQYLIDKVNGNCSRTSLVSHHSHNHGIFGGSGEMVSPNGFLNMLGNFSYLGPDVDRHMEDHRWTTTRHGIYDYISGTTLNKAVLEWEFLLQPSERPERSSYSAFAPVRSNLFLYNNEKADMVDHMVSVNVYDYSAIRRYTPDEFSVYECAEQRDFDVSYLVLLFLTDPNQHAAAQEATDQIVHQVYYQVMTYGQISPVRIADIDITDGLNEPSPSPNYTDSTVMLVSVRLMERVPYIFSYEKDTETPSLPGVNEEKLSGISSKEECAEFCSLNDDYECKSFQVCDDSDCYLSKTVDQDGEPVPGVQSCEHWVLSLENISFVDLPTEQAYHKIIEAVIDDKFTLTLHTHEGGDVGMNASEAFLYNNPDPMDAISRQFTTFARHYRLAKPDNDVQGVSTLLECEALCLNIQEYTCASLSYTWTTGDCRTSALHADEMDASGTQTFSHSDVLTKSYMTEYLPVPGRVSLNSSGPVYPNVASFEACARLCSIETSITCRSFNLCFNGECQLHEEAYLGAGEEANYSPHSQCSLFSKQSKSSFVKHSNQGLGSDHHKLVLTRTTTDTCAQLCIDNGESVCESYDFCEVCQQADAAVCGTEGDGQVNVCFLSGEHLGEAGVTLLPAANCQHYEREYFGDLTYAQWKNSLIRAQDDPYGPGDMAGLAVGMIVLGVLLAVGFLYLMAHPWGSKTPSLNVSFASLRRKSERSVD